MQLPVTSGYSDAVCYLISGHFNYHFLEVFHHLITCH